MKHLMLIEANSGYKYLCKYSRNNPMSYSGSGKIWVPHVKKHGVKSRFILASGEDITLDAFVWSNIFGLVNDFEANKKLGFLNFIPENGMTGGNMYDRSGNNNPFYGLKHTKESLAKMSNSHLKMSDDTKSKIKSNHAKYWTNKKHSQQTIEKMKIAWIKRKNKM